MLDIIVALMCIAIIIGSSIFIARDFKDIFKAVKAEWIVEDAEIEKAKQELAEAEQEFNYASKEYIDIAVYKLKAAEEKFRIKLLQKRIG